MPRYILNEKVLGRNKISELVKELGEKIRNYYSSVLNGSNESLYVIGIPEGCVFFSADLVRAISPEGQKISIKYGTISASSYGVNGTTAGDVKLGDLKLDITGKHVLITDTVVDSGSTFHKVLDLVKSKNPASIRTCCLIDKSAGRKETIPLDFVGERIAEDRFLVGYGIDVAENFRNLPDVWDVKSVQN